MRKTQAPRGPSGRGPTPPFWQCRIRRPPHWGGPRTTRVVHVGRPFDMAGPPPATTPSARSEQCPRRNSEVVQTPRRVFWLCHPMAAAPGVSSTTRPSNPAGTARDEGPAHAFDIEQGQTGPQAAKLQTPCLLLSTAPPSGYPGGGVVVRLGVPPARQQSCGVRRPPPAEGMSLRAVVGPIAGPPRPWPRQRCADVRRARAQARTVSCGAAGPTSPCGVGQSRPADGPPLRCGQGTISTAWGQHRHVAGARQGLRRGDHVGLGQPARRHDRAQQVRGTAVLPLVHQPGDGAEHRQVTGEPDVGQGPIRGGHLPSLPSRGVAVRTGRTVEA